MKYIAAKVALVMTLVTSTALAAAWSTTSSTIDMVEIDNVSGTGTSTWVGFTSTPNNKPGCGTQPQCVFMGSAEHVRAMTSLATAAMLAGRPVRVNWEGTCQTGGYAKIQHLMMLP